MAPGRQRTQKPVPLDRPGRFDDAVTMQVVSTRPMTAKAKLPGEVAGPAVALSVRLVNGSSRPVDVADMVVTLTGSDGAPGYQMTVAPSKPFRGVVQPRQSAEGVYVFTVAKDKRNPVEVSFTLAAQQPVVVFRGKVG